MTERLTSIATATAAGTACALLMIAGHLHLAANFTEAQVPQAASTAPQLSTYEQLINRAERIAKQPTR
jgi:hypothetical protein